MDRRQIQCTNDWIVRPTVHPNDLCFECHFTSCVQNFKNTGQLGLSENQGSPKFIGFESFSWFEFHDIDIFVGGSSPTQYSVPRLRGLSLRCIPAVGCLTAVVAVVIASYDGLPKCLFLVLLINRNSLGAASYLVFKTMTCLNSLKSWVLSFTFEAIAKTCSKC